MDITIMSENTDKIQGLKNLFNNEWANIKIADKKNLIRMFAIYKAANQEEYIPSIENFILMFNFENMLLLVVDDAELLYVLPLSDNSVNAINSKNMMMIRNSRLIYRAMSSYVIDPANQLNKGRP
jgi:hypothetical protein